MSGKAKLQIYSILISLIVTIMCIAVMKPGQHTAATGAKNITPEQELRALEYVAPKSSAMSKFIRHEQAAQQENDRAADGLNP